MEVVRTVEYEDGEFIILEGGQSDRDIFVVMEGQVKVTKETDKGQVTIAMLEEGDIVGESSFLAQKHGIRTASAMARGRVKIGVLDNDKLTAEYHSLSPVFQKILQDLSTRFRKTTELASRLAVKRMVKPNLERREARRSSAVQSLRIKVEYLSEALAATETLSGLNAYQGILIDLAATGMGLELLATSFAPSTHPLGGKFVFQFTLPNKPLIRVPGHIVWTRAIGGKKARMGVKFSETNPYLTKVIEEFLKELME
jgi:CRP-like cAMP-binding protein